MSATTPPVRVAQHVPLAHLWRDGMVEGVHHGSAVLLSPTGEVLFEIGDTEAAMFPRSAAKPLQAVAMVRLGLDVPDDQLVLAAASHSGEEEHLAVAERTLRTAGVREQDLGNPADLPYDAVERERWIRKDRTPRRLAHNCSGKHAAMLATCEVRQWSSTDYLRPDHPLQTAVAATVEELTGQRIARVAVDGCGAPLFAVSLRGLARAVGRIAAAAPGTAEARVAGAIRRHPELVAGTRRDTTALMRAVPGLIAKDGFESVQVAALPDGTAIAIKVADGSDRARLPVLLALLERAGVDPDVLDPFRSPALTAVAELRN